MKKILDELEKFKAYLYVNSDEIIGNRIAKGIPLTKIQQDIYLSKSTKRKLVKNIKR